MDQRGQKISKSLGNVIDPIELIDTYGLDQTRYFLLREVPFGNDGDFSRAAMITRMNRDLANDYGNLVQRVLSMIQRNCDGRLPQPGALTADDRALLDASAALLGRVREEMAVQALNRALEAIFEVIGAANRYVDAQAPWALRKTDPARMATVLFVLAETIRRIALLTQAFGGRSSTSWPCRRMRAAARLPGRGERACPRGGAAGAVRRVPAPRGRDGRCWSIATATSTSGAGGGAGCRDRRARAAGVGVMQTIGTRLGTFEQVLAIAEAYPDVYCSVGVHPHRRPRSRWTVRVGW